MSKVKLSGFENMIYKISDWDSFCHDIWLHVMSHCDFPTSHNSLLWRHTTTYLVKEGLLGNIADKEGTKWEGASTFRHFWLYPVYTMGCIKSVRHTKGMMITFKICCQSVRVHRRLVNLEMSHFGEKWIPLSCTLRGPHTLCNRSEWKSENGVWKNMTLNTTVQKPAKFSFLN